MENRRDRLLEAHAVARDSGFAHVRRRAGAGACDAGAQFARYRLRDDQRRRCAASGTDKEANTVAGHAGSIHGYLRVGARRGSGPTLTPTIALFENSLSRTSTLVVPAPGTTNRPVLPFERTTVDDTRTELPPSMRMPACDMFEITVDSMCTSPAWMRMPLSPPWPLMVSPRSTTRVAGAATITHRPRRKPKCRRRLPQAM